MEILNRYEQAAMQVTEYTKDGETVSHVVKTLNQKNSIEPVEPHPTIEEMQMQTLLNTEYIVVMSE